MIEEQSVYDELRMKRTPKGWVVYGMRPLWGELDGPLYRAWSRYFYGSDAEERALALLEGRT